MIKVITMIFAIATAVSMFIAGLVLTNINLDQHTQLIEREKVIQRGWIDFSLEKNNKSLQIIQTQSERVELLENKLENANIVMQTTISELERRERLLVSTAKQLQEVIDALAIAKTKLDVSYREVKYLGLRVSSLADSLYKSRKRVRELKAKLKSKEITKPLLPGIHSLEDLL